MRLWYIPEVVDEEPLDRASEFDRERPDGRCFGADEGSKYPTSLVVLNAGLSQSISLELSLFPTEDGGASRYGWNVADVVIVVVGASWLARVRLADPGVLAERLLLLCNSPTGLVLSPLHLTKEGAPE